LPALAVDPDPGEIVWDACAAPGSKTTQLAALMDDTGVVIGNDNNLGRLSALRHNAERLGVTNLVVTNQDARNFSFNPFGGRTERANRIEAFDHALVDAPCSCEGTIRKNPDAFEQWSREHVMSVVAIQKDILRRAVQATRPGGTVVYSTCTFAPEENEGVVNHVLESESCRVVQWNPPAGFKTISGITHWDNESYDPSMELTHRVYPHHNDTGGFFCAKLEVTS
jgi:NOL1/NOP2/sun family putative RNA methylase